MASLDPRLPIGDILAEPLRAHGVAPPDGSSTRVRELLRARRPPARAREPLSAGVLRRTAPAHRHRSRARPRAEDAGARRTGVGARRVGAGRRHQPARAAARAAGPLVPVRGARPRGGPPHRRPRGRDVSRHASSRSATCRRCSSGRRTPTRRRCCPRSRCPIRGRNGSDAASSCRATCPARPIRRRGAASARAARSSHMS